MPTPNQIFGVRTLLEKGSWFRHLKLNRVITRVILVLKKVGADDVSERTIDLRRINWERDLETALVDQHSST